MGHVRRGKKRTGRAGVSTPAEGVIEPSLTPDARASENRLMWSLVAAGLVIRLAVCLCSVGSNDTLNFAVFAERLHNEGLLSTYRNEPEFNHPPLVAYWCLAARAMAGGIGFAFAVLFRLPMLFVDAATAWLIGQIARHRGATPRAAALLAGAYAFNLVGILVSAFHCNTDAVYAALSLLAVYLLEDRRRPLLAGLALGLAINIKLIPLLLIVPLCLTSRSWREVLAFVGGLAVMAIPFLPPLLTEPAFARNVLAYRPEIQNWGVALLLGVAGGRPLLGAEDVPPDHPAVAYHAIATPLLLGAVLAWSLGARVLRPRRGWDRYRVAAVTYALLLVLAQGFGVQYLIVVAPLLHIAASPRIATLYGLLAGLFLLGVYFVAWDLSFPVEIFIWRRYSGPSAFLGLLPWALLLAYILFIAPRRRSAAATAEPLQRA